MDQSKKTMRHFYCRDVLWETFEQMANDFDCSIDYLVNEAMRYYARSKNYQSPGAPQMTGAAPVSNNTSGPTSYPGGKGPGGSGGAGAAMRGQPSTQPPPAASPAAAQSRRPAPPTPGYQPPASARGGGGGGPGMNGPGMQQHAPAA